MQEGGIDKLLKEQQMNYGTVDKMASAELAAVLG